ncbi:MAG: SCP2 sterol-binding domain-containing protein [Proteobacteria bacterium]|nr:SCP2 sterol-binding domain-containing protein [Pseudomonadota bacterium]
MVSRPPNDITPARFFETWLPAQYQQLAADLELSPPDISVHVELTGQSGGTWTLVLAGGTLAVNSGTGPDADLMFVQSVDDWRTITTGEGLDPRFDLAAESSSLDKLLVHPALHQMASSVSNIKGTVDFEIRGAGPETLSARMIFHGAAEPHATISVAAETLAEIRDGQTTAPEAYFAGKFQVDGDAALAMQLGMLLMAPPS